MLKGDVDLFNHVIGETDIAGCGSAGTVFDDIFISFTDCHMTGILHG